MSGERERLEYLRGELRAERISMSELAELQGLAEYIAPGDAELLEAAGVPEFPDEDEDDCPVLIEVQGPPAGERVGACACGRPIFRSLIAGTIYHASEDGWVPRTVDDDGTVHPARPEGGAA